MRFNQCPARIALLLVCLSGGSVAAASLVGHWRLDEGSGTTSVDASGSSATATLRGGANWTTGRQGHGIALNGVDGRLTAFDGGTALRIREAVTVSGWVYRAAVTGYFNTVLSRQVGATSQEHMWLGFFDTRIHWFIRTTAGYSSLIAGPVMPLNKWVHVAGTYDGTKVQLYVDGVQQSSVVHQGTFTSDVTPIVMGAGVNDAAGTPLEAFKGIVDEVRVYDYALTQADVQALFASGGAPTNQQPSVTLTQPVAGTSFTAPASVALAATATDTDGTIARVEFYNGATKLGEDTAAPYTYNWTGVGAGQYVLTARAFDNAGASTTSAPVGISVTGATSTGALLGHWKFDEGSGATAADSSGNSNTATLVNTPSWTAGRIAGGLTFDGSDDFVRVPNSAALNQASGAITIAAWIRWSGGGDFQPVVSRQVGGGTGEHYWLGVIGRQVRWFVNTTAGYSDTSGAHTIAAGTWVHIAGTYDGSRIRLYADGVERFSAPHTGTFAAETNPMVFGGGINNLSGVPNERYAGSVDDARLYSNALSAAEINALFTGSGTTNQQPSVALTQPVAGTSFTAPASVALAAPATDADGTIARVEFYNGATKLGEDTTAPYTYNWTGVGAGQYVLTARAFDNTGASTVSTGVEVRVSSGTSALRIMPIGDSITHGYNVSGGYRNRLWSRLSTAGRNVDFVGTMNDGPPPLPDRDHEGHPGFRTVDISPNIPHWVGTYRPDIVLLMIGTNDVYNNFELSALPARLSQLIDGILAAQPSASVIVASVPPWADPVLNQRTLQYNAAIPGVVDAKAQAGKKVYFANVYPAINVSDLADGVHPTAAGYDKLADVWYGRLASIFWP